MNIENISTGVDIEDISRFEKYTKNTNSAFLNRVFTKKEIEYCFSFNKNIAEHLAVRYCAKEATYKALSALNIEGINYIDIEILNNQNGVPEVFVEKEKELIFKISLSHGNNTAIASVIVIKK